MNQPTKRHTLRKAYKIYLKDGGILSYDVYRAIVCEFNKASLEQILEGRILELGTNLAAIGIARVPRTGKRVDWVESNKLKEELIAEGKTPYHKERNPNGEKWYVYYTDDHYFRFHWDKYRCVIKNKTAYSFIPTQGPNGNSRKLAKLLKDNPFAQNRFAIVKPKNR